MTKSFKKIIFIFSGFFFFLHGAQIPEFKLSWPTPNPAFAKGLGYSTFLQKTGPEKSFSSGAFGCVRNNGYKFHEGLDLYPVKRDKKGKAIDLIYSAMDGVVSHVNSVASYSAYGKYIVIEHTSVTPSLYSLYAHLYSIADGIKIGTKVKVAQTIGQMGNTSSGYHIPLSRSHLHFEIGLRLTDQFQKWYDKKSFRTKNRHGNFSGFNLVGLDPIEFFASYKQKSISSPIDFLNKLPVTVVARVKSSKVPDFALRYPSLCEVKNKAGNSWYVTFGPYGIPLKIVRSTENLTTRQKDIEILKFNSETQKKPCRRLVTQKGSIYYPSEQLQTYIELLFGV